MTDDDAPPVPHRPGTRDDGAEHRSVGQAGPLARLPKAPQAEPAGPAAPWHPPVPWAADDDSVPEQFLDAGADLVNLGFFRAAVRRSRPLWIGLAVVGLLIGMASWLTRPPMSQASTTLLLTVGPEAQPGTAILNDQTIAQSRGVAAIALHHLGLRESIDSLLSTYTTTVLTDRVLRITVSAPSSSQAVRRANAIASAFLTFRAEQLRAQQRLQSAALDSVLTRSEQRVQSISAQLAKLAAQPASAAQQSQLRKLRETENRAMSALAALKEQVSGAEATAADTTAAMIAQSKVLDAASPVAHSRFKPLILSSLVGLFVGLVIGLSIVVIRALTSDRLRRRDDVALALGAPVKLSIRALSVLRRGLARTGSPAVRGSDMRAIVDLLRRTASGERQPASLAVVPVDDPAVPAHAVVSLAASLAREGAQVVVADLCAGSPAASRLGVEGAGVHETRVDDARFSVVLPDSGETAPVGPFVTSKTDPSSLSGERGSLCARADVLLTLATVDPAIPGDYLSTWAAEAVVFVTAGRSSWTRVHAAGELVRLAGTRLVAAVLIGADKGDETLGVTPARGARAGRAMAASDNSPESAPPDGRTVSEFLI